MAKPIPTPPAPEEPLLLRLLHGDAEEARAAIRAADRREGYLHWDEFRHRPTPPGWSAEDLWRLLVVTQRSLNKRLLPHLRQKDGRPFHLVRTDPLQAALSRIDRKERLWSVLGRASRTDDDVAYRLMALIDEAHHSSAIEGAVTTRRRSIELIRGERPPNTRSERMVLNTFAAVEHLEEWSQQVLSPELLREMQATVTKDTLERATDVGRFRVDDDVRVVDATSGEVVHVPPPHGELPERIRSLCQFANEATRDEDDLHPLTRASLLHHQLAYDHPFGDGNGRTARTLFLWSALRAGYGWFRSLSVSRSIHRAREQYFRSFRYVQTDGGDVTYFVRSQLRFVEQEIEMLARYLERLAALARWLAQRNAIVEPLNERQLALFEHALVHPDHEFTVREHKAFHDVSQPTAWSDLEGLVRADLLSFETRGRTKLYHTTSKLRALAGEQPPELRRREQE